MKKYQHLTSPIYGRLPLLVILSFLYFSPLFSQSCDPDDATVTSPLGDLGLTFPSLSVSVNITNVTSAGGGDCTYTFFMQTTGVIAIANNTTNIVFSSPDGGFNVNLIGNTTNTLTITAPCGGLSGTVTVNASGTASVDNPFFPIVGPAMLTVSYVFEPCDFTVMGALLPVELTSFSASPVADDEIELKWRTLSENNNEGFEVQRSYDALDWEYLSFVSGSGTSNTVQEYVYSDRLSTEATSIYYRLKQLDFDGAFEYSPVINVNLDRDTDLTALKLYPNPAAETLNIRSSTGLLVIYDAIGQNVYKRQLQDGIHNLNISDLADGAYFLQLQLENGQRINRQLIKQALR